MDSGLVEAARCVRPYLAELLGAKEAADVDAELVQVLCTESNGERAEQRLLSIFRQHEATVEFLERVSSDAPYFRPPLVLAQKRNYRPLEGDMSPVGADKFGCPQSDYVWYRPEVGTPPPRCPTHASQLIRM